MIVSGGRVDVCGRECMLGIAGLRLDILNGDD